MRRNGVCAKSTGPRRSRREHVHAIAKPPNQGRGRSRGQAQEKSPSLQPRKGSRGEKTRRRLCAQHSATRVPVWFGLAQKTPSSARSCHFLRKNKKRISTCKTRPRTRCSGIQIHHRLRTFHSPFESLPARLGRALASPVDSRLIEKGSKDAPQPEALASRREIFSDARAGVRCGRLKTRERGRV